MKNTEPSSPGLLRSSSRGQACDCIGAHFFAIMLQHVMAELAVPQVMSGTRWLGCVSEVHKSLISVDSTVS